MSTSENRCGVKAFACAGCGVFGIASPGAPMPNGWSVVLGDPGIFCATCGKWGQPLPVPPCGGWPAVEWPHRYHGLRWSSDDPTYTPVRAWWEAMA